jgi:hypothetical protein
MNRGDVPNTKAKPDSKGSQADQKMPATGSAQRAPDDAKDGMKDGMKSKGAESKPDKADGKAATEMKADKDGVKADSMPSNAPASAL